MRVCKLCRGASPVEGSHVIPRFVSDWLKETSATGYLRWGENPNLRRQDGFKAPILCEGCEGLLASWEKRFVEEVFRPIESDDYRRVRYGLWMLRFAVSVSWRVGVFLGDRGALRDSHLGGVARDAEEAMETWRLFLLGEVPHPGRFEQHMLPFGLLAGASGDDYPKNLNRYLARSSQIDVVAINDGKGERAGGYIYAKMAHILLIGFLRMPEPTLWKGTKIHVKKGFIGGGGNRYELPEVVLRHIQECARNSGQMTSRMSERQRERIAEAWLENPDRVAQSKTVEAMLQDRRMFGRTTRPG